MQARSRKWLMIVSGAIIGGAAIGGGIYAARKRQSAKAFDARSGGDAGRPGPGSEEKLERGGEILKAATTGDAAAVRDAPGSAAQPLAHTARRDTAGG